MITRREFNELLDLADNLAARFDRLLDRCEEQLTESQLAECEDILTQLTDLEKRLVEERRKFEH